MGLTTLAEAATGVARQGVKAVSAAADLLVPPSDGLVVLIYHRVGRRTTVPVDLPTHLFEEQVAWIAEHGAVTLDEGLRRLQGPIDPGLGRALAVTFDDGTADFVDSALPTLVAGRIPVVLYVATRHIEEQVPFPDDGQPVSWAGLRDAVSTGLVTIGSHTHSHALLDRLPFAQVRDELDRADGLIAERLGVEVQHFAYPKAVFGSPGADAAVRARYRSAAVAGSRPNPWEHTDVFRLARTPVQTFDQMRWFRRKSAGGLRLEDVLRQKANRLRYRNLST